MSSQHDQEQWPEHAVCARCAAPLDNSYKLSPLGLRFCRDCFDQNIQERVKERSAAIYLKGRCSRCGKSLINGYRLSQYGVLYCLSCFEAPPTAPPNPQDEREAAEPKPPLIAHSQKMLVSLVVLAHLLFILNYVLPERFLDARELFRPLVSLDLLTLILLVLLRRFPGSRLAAFWILLMALASIILILKELSFLL